MQKHSTEMKTQLTKPRINSGLWLTLCALMLAVVAVRAQTTNFFDDDFETAQSLDDWTAQQRHLGDWRANVRTADEFTWPPGFCRYQLRRHGPASNYADDTSSRLESKSFVVPAHSQNPRLRFWQWFSFSCNDFGQVQIKVGGGAWKPLDVDVTYTSTGSGIWSESSFDFSAYAGLSVQIGFYFEAHNGSCNGSPVDVSSGWYIDEVRIVTGPITFNNPENFELGLGDWFAERGTWQVGVPTSGPGSARGCKLRGHGVGRQLCR